MSLGSLHKSILGSDFVLWGRGNTLVEESVDLKDCFRTA